MAEEEFRTTEYAVLCDSPFNLKEAVTAMSDQAWLRSIRCIRAQGGLPVRRIQPSNDYETPWQVRVMPPGKAAVTLWGNRWEFTRADGRRID